ncbi:winged helix-turn-helix domain-containing protein [Thalassomonas viridans]|uniref:Winged helix-turn-helix domain-containing protein n=1 Tax=Thalassomonas viridans TaxID=137584 RepID=A0AAE9Z059_9GAMM|nr:winged helix-turn-helix domain-containing protein [Thalassomonas viridans]WDE03609.1 winged helix-turn-helix domain-containing protein [Thalassomonas viridans]
MEVKFADYRFLREQLVLYKQDELIPLKSNQALLLDFFLSDPERIHSKDAIMDSVWQGKVVSEQVVFQTISQLRAVLGDKAIRTFSKKGYQWQLPILPEHNSVPVEAAEQPVVEGSAKERKFSLAWLGVFFILLVISGFIYSIQSPGNKPVSLHLLDSGNNGGPSQPVFKQILSGALEQNEAFVFQEKPLDISVRQAFSAPKLTWQQADLAADNWLIWGDTYTSEQGIFLNFGLSRDNTRWQGYLFAENARKLAHKLAQRLDELQVIGLFSAVNERLDINQLMSMQQVADKDPDLLLLLAKHYISIQQLDVALTYLQKLANLDSSYASRPYQAHAQWYRGKIYKMRRQHLQAANSLETMSAVLADTPLWPLNFHNIKTKAWLAYEQTNYDVMFATLEQGIKLGRKQADALTLFELHIIYSILAQKTGEDHQKYHHLNEAQALLLKHKLDDSNLAVVYYHFALFTEDNSKAIPYLERILTLPRTAQNYWVLDNAFEMLVNHRLEQQDFTGALAMFSGVADSLKKQVLKAKVMQARQEPEQAKPLLQKAFERARLEYDIGTGLQAALMLYQLSTGQPKARAEYLAYLESNAKPGWLRQHNVVLASELQPQPSD